MRERGVGLLLVYGDSRRYGYLAFVSHFMPKNRGALAAIPLAGEPALVVQEPSRNNPFSKTLTWIEEVRSVGQFAQGLTDALKARALQPQSVGLVAVEEQLNIREWNALANVLQGAKLSDCSDLLTSLRLIKSSTELALLRETSRILSETLSLFEKELGPGRKEYEIMALLDREARRQGAEDFRFLIARSSEPHVGLRPAGPASIHKGEGLLVLVAASYQRYWAELGRTFFLGQAPQESVNSREISAKLFRKLVDGLKVGTSPTAADDWLRELELSPAAMDSVRAYGVGNGIGLDLTEEPLLGGNGKVEIKPGMTFTLRVCLHGRDCGSALISQPFIVMAGGLESLVKPVDDLISVQG
jgi:Xaa-Pro dipeptidase